MEVPPDSHTRLSLPTLLSEVKPPELLVPQRKHPQVKISLEGHG